MKHSTPLKPADFCLHTALLNSASSLPGKPSIVAVKHSHAFGELLGSARRIAGSLLDQGFEKGGRVVIYMDNTFVCAASIYGVLMAGGVFVVVNPQTKTEKLEFIVRDAGAFALITDVHLTNNFAPLLNSANSLQCCVVSGLSNGIEPSKIPVIRVDALPEVGAEVCAQVRHTGADLAALIYTSGSTGEPKGVMMSHQSMVFTVASLTEYLRLTEDDILLNVLPLAFDYGLYQLLMSVSLGATLVLERSFTFPAQVYNLIQEHGVTTIPGVPTVFATMVSHHRKKPLRFESIRRITNTAAALPEEHMPLLKEIFPNAMIFKMYGLTECKRVCYLEPALIDSKPFSVGKAIPGTEVLLLDADGNPSLPNEPGILHVRGPHIKQGYWNQPELTRHMLKEGRFPGDKMLCTHDWFKMDEEGFLYFLGRSDDIIKSRGEKVSPIEIENVLYGISGILDAAVVGIPDPILDTAIVAFIHKEPGSELSESEIRRICFSKLENFMVPTRIEFLEQMPKTSTGKISKKDLKALLV